MLTTERRRVPRIAAHLPVEFGSGCGQSIDLSLNGVCFETAVRMDAGMPMRLSIVLDDETVKGNVRMECIGRVVRCNSIGESFTTAVHIESFWFEH